MKTRNRLVVALLILLPVLPAHAQNNYTFTQIADTGGPFNSFGAVSLNNAGTIAFVGNLDGGGNGIFAGNGGPILTISLVNNPFLDFTLPSINDAGVVAFVRLNAFGAATAIQTGSGGPVTTLYDLASGPFLSFDRAVSLNNAGTVAFAAATPGGFRSAGVFAGNGGPLTVIAPDISLRLLGSPSINAAGAVAFADQSSGFPSPQTSGVFVGSGGALTTIADNNGPLQFPGAPSLSDTGTVAFRSALDAGGQGVFTGGGGPVTLLVDSRGPFSGFFSPSLNDAGRIAFGANLDAGGTGIFLGPNPAVDTVIVTGDPLFGSIVTQLAFSPHGLNNNDQIAFTARLADGRQVVVRANPERRRPRVPLISPK